MKRSFRDSAPAWALFSLLIIYFALVAASVYEEGMTVFMRFTVKRIKRGESNAHTVLYYQ